MKEEQIKAINSSSKLYNQLIKDMSPTKEQIRLLNKLINAKVNEALILNESLAP